MALLPEVSAEDNKIIEPKWDVQLFKGKKEKKQDDSSISSSRDNFSNTFQLSQKENESMYEKTDEEYPSIAEFDTFISFNGSHDSQIVQNAIEKGSFRSVNKIKKPDMCVVELAKGGVQYYIETILSNLKKYQGSTEIFRVVTPYGNMDNLNFIKLEYKYSRENGAGLLIAKLTFQEIVSGSVTEDKYSLIKVNTPDKTDTKNTGNKVQRSWEKYK